MRARIWVCLVTSLAAGILRAETFTVTSLADSTATGTLRWAFINVNTTPAAPHIVSFNVPAPFVVAPTGTLPALTQPVRVDGTTQPLYAGSPIVRLIGTNPAIALYGISLDAAGSIVRGLSVERFTGNYGIRVQANTCRVEACHLWTNSFGVGVLSGSNVVVGGTALSNRNVISESFNVGVLLNGPESRGALVQGNFIGTDAAGVLSAGNFSSGIYVLNCASNTIGGTVAGAGNVISGSGQFGIRLSGTGSVYNVVAGNRIGVDVTGSVLIPNGAYGIYVENAPGNRIGGFPALERNIISGNGDTGLLISPDSPDTRVFNNFIGVATNGVTALGNGTVSNGNGLASYSANGLIVSNLIAGNLHNGVLISGLGAVSNFVIGNRIGLGLTTGAVHNLAAGIEVIDAPFTQIGQGGDSNRNFVAGNGGDGIVLRGLGAQGSAVQNNYIGCDVAGGLPRTNAGRGVVLNGVTNVLVADNVIAGNTLEGVHLHGGGGHGVRVRANYIGVASNGLSALPNGESGVRAGSDTSFAVIGGLGASNRNVISGNGAYGVYLQAGTTGILVSANYIGTSTNGTSRVGNARSGVYVNGGRDHWIGATNSSVSGNTISGNKESGVEITGSGPTNVTLVFNRIGFSADLLLALSNNAYGVLLDNAPGRHRIGQAGAGNWIGGNGLDGVLISDTGQSYAGTVVIANRIGCNHLGTAVANRRSGLRVSQAHQLTIGSGTNGNIISGNSSNGFHVYASHNLTFVSNFVGTLYGGYGLCANALGGISCVGPMTNAYFEGNVVSFNGYAVPNQHGIRLHPGCSGFRLENNTIGFDPAGNYVLNNGPGVFIDNSENNRIGGEGAGQGNRIACQGDVGVVVTSVVAGARAGNRIVGNAFAGVLRPIDLQDDGLTTNDPAPDADGNVANELQNYPIITNCFIGSTHLAGRLITAPGTYLVDVMSVGPTVTDRFNLGQAYVNVGASGTQNFHLVVGLSAPTGAWVGVTATDAAGNTSELSPVLTNQAPPSADADNDDMPDWWEAMHGLNPNVANAFTNDFDGDGVTDLNEFQSDTNPGDAASVLAVESLISGNSRLITWASSDTRSYALDYAGFATSVVWTTVSNNILGNGGLLTLADTNAPGADRFYRLRGGQP